MVAMRNKPVFSRSDKAQAKCRLCDKDLRISPSARYTLGTDVHSHFCEKCVRTMAEVLGMVPVQEKARTTTVEGGT